MTHTCARVTKSMSSMRASSSRPFNGTRPKVRTVIKLGGAAITDKAKFETPRPEIINQLSADIAEALLQTGKKGAPDIILVHGAGSFGHHQAKQYNVSSGWKTDNGLIDPHVQLGACSTRASAAKLNQLVVQALVGAGLPAYGIPPMASGWTTNNRQLVTDGCDLVAKSLSAGLLPVLYGDVVYDEGQGCAILSGDTLVRRLAEVFQPEYVLFLTNVPGVYDRPPEQEGAQLLQTIRAHADGGWSAHGLGSQHMIQLGHVDQDVTGGISGKIEEAACIARTGIPVAIAQAGSPAGMAAVMGMPAVGTHNWQGTLVLSHVKQEPQLIC